VGDRNPASLICLVCDSEMVAFQHLLEVVKEYSVNVSIIEWAGASAILLRMQEQDKGLSRDALDAVIDKLKTRIDEQPLL